MSDFGFDAYALDDLDPTGAPHPLEIARDLIATGKPRSALEVLAEHHKRLADDPDYLMLCGEAWGAAGDAPRAQHALLGAIRVAPQDPHPLQLLGDLLIERGEEERARRVFEKARRLELAESGGTALEEADGETLDDLIAFAQREERTRQTPVNPRKQLFVGAVILGIGLLMSGIALLVAPESEPGEEIRARSDAPIAEEPPSAPATTEPTSEIEVAPRLAESEQASAEVLTAPTVASVEVPLVTEPVIEALNPTPVVAPRAKRNPKPSPPKRKKVESSPVPADFDAELAASTDAAELTARADALSARGQLSSAAKFYRRALEIDPDYAPALIAIGRSFLRADNYAEAMRNATRALQLARGVDARPGLEAEALYQMGQIHHQLGEEDAARRLLRQSTLLPRAPAEAWFYLGESLSRDNSPAARNAYEQYLERKPNGHLSDRARRAIQ
ncbi:MAG: tetratricopeptide repeat protein [Deltaproteobacteria bacterium]|nr:tetratricopeptide repeat protein [Deltaproteobacteria bacterium]